LKKEIFLRFFKNCNEVPKVTQKFSHNLNGGFSVPEKTQTPRLPAATRAASTF